MQSDAHQPSTTVNVMSFRAAQQPGAVGEGQDYEEVDYEDDEEYDEEEDEELDEDEEEDEEYDGQIEEGSSPVLVGLTSRVSEV